MPNPMLSFVDSMRENNGMETNHKSLETDDKSPEPEQVKNPGLLAAIADLNEKQSDDNWTNFYKELMAATFLLVGAVPVGDGADGKQSPPAGEPPPESEPPQEKPPQIAFIALRDDVGQVLVPAFTDAATLETWAPAGYPWMVVPAFALVAEVVRSPVAQLEINRHCDGQWRVTHDELLALARGETPQRAVSIEVLQDLIEHPNSTIKPLPSNWPPELVSALWNALVLERAVVDAYAFEVIAGDSKHAVVGLRFTERPDPAFFTETSDKLLTLSKRLIAPGQSLAFMPLNEREVLARVVESVEPFFARR